jgi:polyisoprenoid-binding protein YceI
MIFQKFRLAVYAAPVVAVLAIVTAGQPALAQSDAASGTYKAQETHRYITFSYEHLGYSNPWLRWRDWDATLEWNAEDPEASSISVVIDVNSIDSGVDVFDGHLKSDRFFDAENYPEITFVSTAINQIDETTGSMTGDLTIRDVTKPVTLDVVFNKGDFNARDNEYKLGFSAKTSVNRSDFGIDYAVPVVGDTVNVVIEAEFVMPAESNG